MWIPRPRSERLAGGLEGAGPAAGGRVRDSSKACRLRPPLWPRPEAQRLAVDLEGGDEGFLRDLDLAELPHALLAGLLFVEQLALAGDVAAIAFGGDVFA